MDDSEHTCAITFHGLELVSDAPIRRSTRTMAFVEVAEPLPVGADVDVVAAGHRVIGRVARVYEKPTALGTAGMWLRFGEPVVPLGGGQANDPMFPEPAVGATDDTRDTDVMAAQRFDDD